MNPQTIIALDGVAVALALGLFYRHELFRLAERIKRAHSATAAAVRPLPASTGSGSAEGGKTMDHKQGVAALLGGAAGAAEAMTDCGIEVDDAELVAQFIEGMDDCRATFLKHTEDCMTKARAAGVPEDELASVHDAATYAMQMSPSFTNTLFLWRLASAFKTMASRDVLEAAREVVKAHNTWREISPGMPNWDVDATVAKLAAALPKER